MDRLDEVEVATPQVPPFAVTEKGIEPVEAEPVVVNVRVEAVVPLLETEVGEKDEVTPVGSVAFNDRLAVHGVPLPPNVTETEDVA